MQKRLQRLDGVAKVEVELLTQKVVLHPKPDGGIDLSSLLKATHAGGVTPVEMIVTAGGRVVKDAQGAVRFRIAAKQEFEVVSNDASRSLEGLAGSDEQVTLRGRMFQMPPSQKFPKEIGTLRFEILEVLKKP